MQKVWNGLKIWWRGIPPSITETEKGYRLIYQNPNHPPVRERLKAMVVRAATFKGAIGAIAVPLVVAVLAAAIIKWLGLT